MNPPAELHRSASADIDAVTLYRLLKLRVDVFVVEQACPYPELDGRDLEPGTRHFWIADTDGTVLSTLRLLVDSHGPGGDEFRIGRVCTDRSARGRGLTARLLRAALDEVGDNICRIGAQTYLTEMYMRFGFRPEGAEYLEDGIPHVSMVRPGRSG